MPIPAAVLTLIEQFEAGRDEYRAAAFNETQLRRQFLDPFFGALGWDVANQKGQSAARRDVSHEFHLPIEGEDGGKKSRAPDYAFRIGEASSDPVFFVEAKKPSVNVRDSGKFAFQTREYGWNRKLPFCVLTDFEEFAVYDCRSEPVVTDGPEKARVDFFTFDQYAAQWDTIAGLFGRDAVKAGALAQRAQREQKKGKETVDAAFLKLIRGWRTALAENLVRNNKTLNAVDLNLAVQMTIDRIIFLRMAEDRDLEPWGGLQTIAKGKGIYAALCERFRDADNRYNSGLFHFADQKHSGSKKRPGFEDTLTPSLKIDDGVLLNIISGVYRPSPFNFRVMPIEILGQVYEQFLGEVIRLPDTGPRRAIVEDKPEVRKAGGVYYTPAYIVDAIVKQTVGTLCEGKTPKQIEPLRVLDPACGSGSFLIGAYGFLLAWHLDFYNRNPQAHLKGSKSVPAPLFARPDPLDETQSIYRLTTREKKRILLNNIYGVDIDRQAVEVTKLSLLLKVLEDESSEGLKLLNEPALPDLDANIQCGNSLIAPDFYDTPTPDTLSQAEQDRINAFNWHTAFKPVMESGGFDAVIGNPPYIRIQALNEWAPLEVAHFKRAYKTANKGNYDIYVMFIERALQLLNDKGRLGFILPHKFFNAQYGEATRELLAQGHHVREVVHFGDTQIFDNATTYTCLLFADQAPVANVNITRVTDLQAWRGGAQASSGSVPAASLSGAAWNFSVGDSAALFDKLAAMPVKLGDIAEIFVGTQTSADDVFVLENCQQDSKFVTGTSKVLGTKVKVEIGCTEPFLRGKEIRRYTLPTPQGRVICPYLITENTSRLYSAEEMKANFPLAWKYLEANRKKLEEREKGKFKNQSWYAFGYPKSMTLFRRPKLIVPDYNNVASFTLDEGRCFYKTGYGILPKSDEYSFFYLLGLLNSKLLFRYLQSIGTGLRGGYIRFWTQYIEQLPIHQINFEDAADKARHDGIVKEVEQMLKLQKQLADEKNPASKAQLAARIAHTDAKIDALVGALYGLDAEEIALLQTA